MQPAAFDFGTDFKKAYETVQANPWLSDEEKIRSTVTSLLTIRYESQKAYKAFDFGFLFTDSPEAKETLRYESARLKMFVTSAKHYGSGIQWYNLHPEFEKIQVNGSSGEVVVRGVADIRYYDTSDRFETMGHEPHTFILTKEKGRWKIVKDRYSDEFSKLYPRDTDFVPVLADFEARLKGFDIEDKVKTQKLKSDQRAGNAYSGANRPPVPIHSDHSFRPKSTTDSNPIRPLIPIQIDHLFRIKSTSPVLRVGRGGMATGRVGVNS